MSAASNGAPSGRMTDEHDSLVMQPPKNGHGFCQVTTNYDPEFPDKKDDIICCFCHFFSHTVAQYANNIWEMVQSTFPLKIHNSF